MGGHAPALVPASETFPESCASTGERLACAIRRRSTLVPSPRRAAPSAPARSATLSAAPPHSTAFIGWRTPPPRLAGPGVSTLKISITQRMPELQPPIRGRGGKGATRRAHSISLSATVRAVRRTAVRRLDDVPADHADPTNSVPPNGLREGFAPGGPRRRRARVDVSGARPALARRRLGAGGNGGIVAYGARSPARSAAEGHARIRSLRRRPPAPTRRTPHQTWRIASVGSMRSARRAGIPQARTPTSIIIAATIASRPISLPVAGFPAPAPATTIAP